MKHVTIWDIIQEFEKNKPQLNVRERGLIHELQNFMINNNFSIIKTNIFSIKDYHKDKKLISVKCINPTKTLTKDKIYLAVKLSKYVYYPMNSYEYEVYALLDDGGFYREFSIKRFKKL